MVRTGNADRDRAPGRWGDALETISSKFCIISDMAFDG
jgi:hypothetical protein